MENLSKILIVTNIIFIVMLMVNLETTNNWRAVSGEYIDILDICLDTKARVIDDLDKSSEEYIDIIYRWKEKVDDCNDNWKWIYDNYKDDCERAIDIYKEWC